MAMTVSLGKHFSGDLDVQQAGQHKYVFYQNDKLYGQGPH